MLCLYWISQKFCNFFLKDCISINTLNITLPFYIKSMAIWLLKTGLSLQIGQAIPKLWHKTLRSTLLSRNSDSIFIWNLTFKWQHSVFVNLKVTFCRNGIRVILLEQFKREEHVTSVYKDELKIWLRNSLIYLYKGPFTNYVSSRVGGLSVDDINALSMGLTYSQGEGV